MNIKQSPQLSVFLPIKISGKKCQHNLIRVSWLLKSLTTYWKGNEPLKLHVCVRDDEYLTIKDAITQYNNSVIEINFISENTIVPELKKFPKVNGWFKQMLLKLAFSKVAPTDFYLTIDADVVAVRPISPQNLILNGRAVTHWLPKKMFVDWWETGADFLQCSINWNTSGIGVTPIILSKFLASDTLERIEEVQSENYAQFLLSHSDFNKSVWAEYSLYTLWGEAKDVLSQYHIVESNPQNKELDLQVDFNLWVFDNFRDWQPQKSLAASNKGFFLVCQSNIDVELIPLERLQEELLPIINGFVYMKYKKERYKSFPLLPCRRNI
jgi:hypothetical protein